MCYRKYISYISRFFCVNIFFLPVNQHLFMGSPSQSCRWLDDVKAQSSMEGILGCNTCDFCWLIYPLKMVINHTVDGCEILHHLGW